MKSAMIIAYHN